MASLVQSLAHDAACIAIGVFATLLYLEIDSLRRRP